MFFRGCPKLLSHKPRKPKFPKSVTDLCVKSDSNCFLKKPTKVHSINGNRCKYLFSEDR